ncbi:competence protein ComA, partial [Salmonella enterica subsp. enterica serovar Typhimurium]
GPEGGEDGTPAGTVWFAWNINNTTFTSRQHFNGDCQEVLEKCVRFALAELLFLLTKKA